MTGDLKSPSQNSSAFTASPRRRVALNLVANVAVQILNKLFPIIVYAYAQRKLGTEGLGHALFAIALVDWTTPIVEAGTNNYGQIVVGREHENRSRMGRLLGEILTIRGINAVFAFLGLLLLLVGPYADYRETALFICFITFATAIDMTYVQTGTQRLWALSVLNAGTKLIAFFLLFVFVQSAEDTTTFAALLVGTNAVYCLGTFSAGVRKWRPTLPSFSEVVRAYRAVLPFAIAVILWYGLEKFDYMLVESNSTPTDIGLYGAMSRVFLSIQALLPALALAFGVEMLGARDHESFSRQVERSLGLLAIVVAPIALGVWFVSEALLTTLYDSSYMGAAAAFNLLCISSIPYAIIVVIGIQALTTRGSIRRVNAAMAIGLTLGIGAGFALVPKYGMTGAASAVLIAKIGTMIVILPTISQFIAPRRLLLVTGPSFVAATLMAFVLTFSKIDSLWLTLSVGAAVYLPAAWFFNAAWLAPIIRRRG